MPAIRPMFFVSALAASAIACSDGTSPDSESPPGRRLLRRQEFGAWTWLTGGQEILYSTPPCCSPTTRLEAVAIAGGTRRTVVATPSNGDLVIGGRFFLAGARVYYLVLHPGPDSVGNDRLSLYRAPVAGTSVPERVLALDDTQLAVSVSPDERLLAWLTVTGRSTEPSLVTHDIANGARRTYALKRGGDSVAWSPSGRSVLAYTLGWSAAGDSYQWIDLETGAVRAWLLTGSERSAESTRDFRWDGETPFLYSTNNGFVSRYSLETGVRELLASAPGYAVGWNSDFTMLALAVNNCVGWSGGVFGSNCIHWSSSVERMTWKTGERATVLRHDGRSEIFARLAPTSMAVAYEYAGSVAEGLYVVLVP